MSDGCTDTNTTFVMAWRRIVTTMPHEHHVRFNYIPPSGTGANRTTNGHAFITSSENENNLLFNGTTPCSCGAGTTKEKTLDTRFEEKKHKICTNRNLSARLRRHSDSRKKNTSDDTSRSILYRINGNEIHIKKISPE